jgi:hypothetical protein
MTVIIKKALYDALRQAGVDDKASEAAASVEDVATKGDLSAGLDGLRNELVAKIDALKAEMYKVVAGQTIALVLAMIGLKIFG